MTRRLKLEARKEPIIVSVRTNPEPRHFAAFRESERTVAARHADGIHRFVNVDSLKVQAGVIRIAIE